MFRFILYTALSFSVWGQKIEPGGPPPAEVAPDIVTILDKQGTRILNADGSVFCELWFRATAPPAAASAEPNVTMSTVAHGSLMGVLRFPGPGAERRGMSIKPGVYTLRFSYYPENGDHQGVAPQRDFLILSPAAIDKDPVATPAFDPLMAMSRKASGTPHPASLSCWKVEADFKPGLEKMGDHDWVLQTKIGGIPVAVIVIGKTEA